MTLGWYKKDDEHSENRKRLLIFGYPANIIGNLIGGNFYTGLLLLLGADDAFIGLMSIFSIGANTLQILSPLLLERFPRRKRLLLGLRWANLAINIVGIGLLPFLPASQSIRLALLAVAVLAINLLNALSAPGFSIWHIQFTPPEMRARFFAMTSMTTGLVVALVNLLGGRVVDMFKESGSELAGLTVLRVIALGLAVWDGILLIRMKEYPYPHSSGEKLRLKHLVVYPFREKKYLLTVLMACTWHFVANLSGPFYTVYLLQELEVSYAYLTLIAMANVPILILMTPFWRRVVTRLSWFRTLGISMLLYAVAYVMLALITKPTLWLYPLSQVWGYLLASGINLSFTNIPYVNMPSHSQTLFIAFYSAVSNLAAMLGITVGRALIAGTADYAGNFLGVPMGNKQLLVLVIAILMSIGAIGILMLERRYGEKLQPLRLPKRRRRRPIDA